MNLQDTFLIVPVDSTKILFNVANLLNKNRCFIICTLPVYNFRLAHAPFLDKLLFKNFFWFYLLFLLHVTIKTTIAFRKNHDIASILFYLDISFFKIISRLLLNSALPKISGHELKIKYSQILSQNITWMTSIPVANIVLLFFLKPSRAGHFPTDFWSFKLQNEQPIKLFSFIIEGFSLPKLPNSVTSLP